MNQNIHNTEYPGIFLRVKASTIDSIVIIVLMGATTDFFSRFENVPNYAKIIAFVFIFILYEPMMVSLFGSSMGHRMYNLRVQHMDTKKKINLGTAIIRFLIKATLGWISFLTVSNTENSQALHDTAVKSVVVFDD